MPEIVEQNELALGVGPTDRCFELAKTACQAFLEAQPDVKFARTICMSCAFTDGCIDDPEFTTQTLVRH